MMREGIGGLESEAHHGKTTTERGADRNRRRLNKQPRNKTQEHKKEKKETGEHTTNHSTIFINRKNNKSTI